MLYTTGTASYKANADPRRKTVQAVATPWLMIKSIRQWIETQYGNDWDTVFADMVSSGQYANYYDAQLSHSTQLQSNKFWANNGCAFSARIRTAIPCALLTRCVWRS